MAITLVLADEHPLFLDGLELFCSKQGDFKAVARCLDGKEALRAVLHHRPDIFILDPAPAIMEGIEILQKMKQAGAATRTIIMTATLEDEIAVESIRLGVRGVVLKKMSTERLAQCIRKVHAGGKWLELDSVSRAVEKMLQRESGARRLSTILTPREIEIVRMVAKGKSNREIGTSLLITEGTVKIHLHNVYKKLGIDNRVDLTLYAQRRGVV
jgi:DNA-binding NarL/FixJ family response regulator